MSIAIRLMSPPFARDDCPSRHGTQVVAALMPADMEATDECMLDLGDPHPRIVANRAAPAPVITLGPEPPHSFGEAAVTARQALDEVIVSVQALDGLPPTASMRRAADALRALRAAVSSSPNPFSTRAHGKMHTLLSRGSC